MRQVICVFAGAALLLATGVFAQSPAPVPVGELFPSDNGQPNLQTIGPGMSVVTGSELAAGVAPARLRLLRGGQVRICPHSSLSVNSGSKSGLMFAMGAGTIEVDYQVNPGVADILITPDFSISFVGPAKYHLALGVSKAGDTCVKPLPGNNGELNFSELLGSSVHKVKADERLVFRGGKLDQRGSLAMQCGCPPAPPQLQASNAHGYAAPPNAVSTRPPERPAVPSAQPTTPLPQDRPGQVHVEVDTPFIFSARGAAGTPYGVARLKYSTLPNVYFKQEKAEPVVLAAANEPQVSAQEAQAAPTPEPASQKKEKKGFFGKVGGFFHSLFHH